MPLEEIQQILNKFCTEETKIEELLEKREIEEKIASTKRVEEKSKPLIPFEEVTKRNRQILKDLEVVKGNLRSKAIFSPSEMQWEEIAKAYKENPSLPVTTYRCYPVFV